MNDAIRQVLALTMGWFARSRHAGLLGIFLMLLTVLWLVPAPANAVTIRQGDILVIDSVSNKLLLIDPRTSIRTVVSDFNDPTQGPLGRELGSIAITPDGQLYVSDFSAGDPPNFTGGAIFWVEPHTGRRLIVSNFSQGPFRNILYYGMEADEEGRLLVNSINDTDSPASRIVRVEPWTDRRVLISDSTNAAQGPTFGCCIGTFTLDQNGSIVITKRIFNYEPWMHSAQLYRIPLRTGNRILISDILNPAQGETSDLWLTFGLSMQRSERGDAPILVPVTDINSGSPLSVLFAIDPRTGQRTVLSDFNNPAQGMKAMSTFAVAVENDGAILVAAENVLTAKPLLFRIDPKTGNRTVLSDGDNPSQGVKAEIFTAVRVVRKEIKTDDEHKRGSLFMNPFGK